MGDLFPQAYAAVDSAKIGSALNPIIVNIIEPAIALLFAVALVVFVWSIVQYIIKGGEEGDTKRLWWSILGGVIGMALMLSAWGIIHLVANTVYTFGR